MIDSKALERDASGKPLRTFPHPALNAFLRDRRGTTAIEYGLICALIFLVIITSVTTFGGKTTGLMNNISAAISNAISG